MFLTFFELLRLGGLPVSIKDLLHLLEALKKGVGEFNVDDFYYLSRSVFVKDESHYDTFDQLFAAYFKEIENIDDSFFNSIPEDWLKKGGQRNLSEEEKELLKSLGGLDKLMERMKELLEEQKKRHEGGSKWIGTGGTSPFGAYGYNPQGFRIGQEGSGARRAIKVWDKREFKNLNSNVELDTRNIKMALKSLRVLTREGNADELDLDATIKKTSKNAGLLDIHMVPSKHNNVKVLLFLDIGGSMDDHVESCEQLFSAAKYEFKHLEHYYFHNCLYEYVWKDNNRRRSERINTYDVFHKFNSDYKVIFIGDATMSPIEITYEGGSVEHWNKESGIVWLKRLKNHFQDIVWINPSPVAYWSMTPSTKILREVFNNKMFPMTLAGIAQAMKALKNRKISFDL
ncbi:MAG: VWA domain-containing protein [Bacteroidota bacterium]